MASRAACGSFCSSVQSSFERVKVSGSCGSGTTSASHPCSANSPTRPSAVAVPSSGSGWLVKNCQGVLAPHSSPMNSIGVNGEVSTIVAPTASSPGERDAEIRSPTARLPIWSWSCR